MRSEAEIRAALVDVDIGIAHARATGNANLGMNLLALADGLKWALGEESLVAGTLSNIATKRKAQRQ